MSELYHNLTFRLSGEPAKRLDQVFKGMLDGELGARLQDRMDAFGDAVAQKLEGMFDEGLMEIQVEHYNCDGDRFELLVMSGFGGEDFLVEFMELLDLCGVADLRARLEGDGYAQEYWLEDGEVMEGKVVDDE